MNTEIVNKVIKIIYNETGLEIKSEDFDKDYLSVLDLDSVQLLSISAKIEQELNIELPLSSMGINTLNDLFKLIETELIREA